MTTHVASGTEPNECWLGFPYANPICLSDGPLLAIDRNDGAYPTPHWGGKFVLLVDDSDVDWPQEKKAGCSGIAL